MRRKNNLRRREKPGSKYKTNEKIRVPEIRVVQGMPTNDVYSTKEALKEAQNQGLDLVMISERANPPVCKIIDFNKFLYEEKKRKKELEKKQVKIEMKEIRFTSNTDKGDVETKKKKIIEFLEKGNKVKLTVYFKGRNIVFKDRGEKLLLQIADDLSEIGIPENMPKMDGRRMSFIIKSKLGKK